MLVSTHGLALQERLDSMIEEGATSMREALEEGSKAIGARISELASEFSGVVAEEEKREDGSEDDEVDMMVDECVDPADVEALASVVKVPRAVCGRRNFVVHERDAHDFWNLRRWSLRPTLLLYRYEATGSWPVGVCDLSNSAVEDEGPIVRLKGEGYAVEARFDAGCDVGEWRCAVDEALPEAQREAVAACGRARDEALARAKAATERADVAEAVASELETQLAAASARLAGLERSAGESTLEVFVDRCRAARAADDAWRSAARIALDRLERDKAALSMRLAAAETQLCDRTAEARERDLVDRDLKKRHHAERKLLVKEVLDLRRRLQHGSTAHDARDVVENYWDAETSPPDDDDGDSWLLDSILRAPDVDDHPPRQFTVHSPPRSDVVVTGRDLSSGETFGLTPEQIAFQKRNAAAAQGTVASRLVAQAVARFRYGPT